jgi:hypothetical protein
LVKCKLKIEGILKMKKIFTLVIVLLSLIQLSGQISSPQHFANQNTNLNNDESSLVKAVNGDLLMFWIPTFDSKIYYSRSTNNGLSWNQSEIAALNIQRDNLSRADLSTLVLSNGRILLSYKAFITVSPYGHHKVYVLKYSDDNGLSWSDPYLLPTTAGPAGYNQFYLSSLSLTSDGKAAFVFSTWVTSSAAVKGIKVIYSQNGTDWTPVSTIDSEGKYGTIVSSGSSKDLLLYEDLYQGSSAIFKRTTTDGGQTWSNREILIYDSTDLSRSRAISNSNNNIWIYYLKKNNTSFSGVYQSEICFIRSTDSGNNWFEPDYFTNYAGIDSNHNVTVLNNQPLLSFTTSRKFSINQNYMQIYYGTEPDVSTPPYVHRFIQSPDSVMASQPVNIKAFADDNIGINSVEIIIIKNNSVLDTLTMFDDGMHNDSLANDNIYGINLSGFNPGDGVLYHFLLYDNEMNIAGFKGGEINIPLDFYINGYRMDINRFKVPFNHNGVIADVNINGQQYGWYDESVILFSGGFWLSGKIGDTIWGSSVASASRLQDYQPGIVGTSPNDPKNQLYLVKASDPHFGESWQNYSYAVQLGAKFYDGNNDGIYNPVDLNGNGIWDLNEDRPDMLGDVTLWCVYNDGVPGNLRRFNNMYPLGVEIKQTVFALGENLTGPIENMFFVRYIINNTGTVLSEIDSVVFTGWADPDLGDAFDDIVGSDTLLNAGYLYNSGSDGDYGVNPPAIAIAILQGGLTYIPGETFIDNNNNDIYDPGIDIPLDTAYNNNGLFLGSSIFPGAKNTTLSSFVHYLASHASLGDPNTVTDLRNYSMGLHRSGYIIDPCTWYLGTVLGGVDCSQVNPFYWYSGDPVTQTGWINIFPTDQRIVTNTGMFKLKANEPVELWLAYVVGRGVDSLDSVTRMKEHVQYAHRYYKSNFTYLPSDVADEIIIPGKFELYQNYPNPFNPSTIIRYQIPDAGFLTLKLYDVLGREVTTLVNEFKQAGRYEVEFDGSNYASGVYFYKIQTGEFVLTNKMIMIK